MNSGVTFSLLVGLNLLWAGFVSVNADGQLCSELINIDQTNEKDKANAHLCELVQAAGMVEEMARAMADGMVNILNEQGITVDDDSTDANGRVAKRKNEYLRFGKRKNEYLRFGKRKNEYLRFGK